MANELTHALFAGAVMAALNPLFGLDVIGWNVFLAGMVAMLFNLDRVETAVGKRSPVGHSIIFILILLYVMGCAIYLFCVLTDTSLLMGGTLALAAAVGAFTHLFLDALTGSIFTFPKNLKIRSWLKPVDAGFERFWGSWGRLETKWHVKESYLNACSIAILLVVIAVF